jgi:hypothetical protein
MSEQEEYGTIKSAEPIPVPTQGPYIATTPPASAPDPSALRVVNAVIVKDLITRREQRSGGS